MAEKFELTNSKAKEIVETISQERIGKELYNLLTIFSEDKRLEEDENLKNEILELMEIQKELFTPFFASGASHSVSAEGLDSSDRKLKRDIMLFTRYVLHKKIYAKGDNLMLLEMKFTDGKVLIDHLLSQLGAKLGSLGKILSKIEDITYECVVAYYLTLDNRTAISLRLSNKKDKHSMPEESDWLLSEGPEKGVAPLKNIYLITGKNIRQIMGIPESDAEEYYEKNKNNG